jgi:hypothetical protein
MEATATEAPARKLSLLEIVEGILAVFDEIDAVDGEVTEETGAKLDALSLSLEQKGEGYAAVIRMAREQAAASRAFAKRYTERAARKERQADALETRLFEAMKATGRKKIETATVTLAIQKSPASLKITGPVPAEYLKPGEPDKTKIKGAVIAGDAEACGFAVLESGEHLRLR